MPEQQSPHERLADFLEGVVSNKEDAGFILQHETLIPPGNARQLLVATAKGRIEKYLQVRFVDPVEKIVSELKNEQKEK